VTADFGGAPAGTEDLPTRTARPPRRAAVGCLIEVVETLVLTLIIFWVIQSFVAQPFKIDMESMERTLEPDQYVLVDKLTPAWDTYKRGDVVVFRPPSTWVRSDRGEPYIKRVIAVGGDRVEIRDGSVYVNDIQLAEPYVYQEDGGPQPTSTFSGIDRWVIPDGQLFLLGDHRSNSSDSREGGPVDVSAVIGRAWLRYWPIGTFSVLETPRHPELATPAP
jgi:signal peptidase I